MSDDSPLLIVAKGLFSEGLRRLFSDSSFTAVHMAPSIEDALPLAESMQPSLMLVDLPDGCEVQTERMVQILAAAPRMRIVVLTEAIQGNRLADALAAGVDGYLLRSISVEALRQSLRLVLLGEKVFSTDLAHLLTKGRTLLRGDCGPVGNLHGLSDREVEILRCLYNGDQNKQIAHQLGISDGTVKVHLKAIMKKIHVQNRTQAAVWAMNHRAGLGIIAGAPRAASQVGKAAVKNTPTSFGRLRDSISPVRRLADRDGRNVAEVNVFPTNFGN
jgi:two-component system nitrate/nitrite response regulator NarL